jgi:hypothetical protein
MLGIRSLVKVSGKFGLVASSGCLRGEFDCYIFQSLESSGFPCLLVTLWQTIFYCHITSLALTFCLSV